MSDILKKLRDEECRKVFDQLDEDGDGKITTADLRASLKSAGLDPDDEDIKDIFPDLVNDKHGTVDFKEFQARTQIQVSESTEDGPAKNIFKKFDEDGDGFLTKSELRKALENLISELSDDVFDGIMEVADINKDGNVDFARFNMIVKGMATSGD
ncbi:calmodulin-like 3 [Coemansia furcata]|uniref:Calmodulin-like 3 n=1 Tax=Coemansia furcata TaxID=417177 RepID=A0ACC1LNY5_9FUNG|nr:calmodulin-like 3 [Coemansia furcata]